MSFASTPLGQGRRLDHRTFLNKKPLSTSSLSTAGSSTHIQAGTRTQRSQAHPPASYAYGCVPSCLSSIQSPSHIRLELPQALYVPLPGQSGPHLLRPPPKSTLVTRNSLPSSASHASNNASKNNSHALPALA